MIFTLQVAFGALVFAFVARWIRSIAFDGCGVEAKPFAAAFRKSVTADRERAIQMAAEARRSWVGRLASACLEAQEDGADVGLALAAEYQQVRFAAFGPLRLLRQLARAAVFVGLLAGMGEVIWAQYGPRGLDALAFGVAEARGERKAVLAIAIGFALAAVALAARRGLRGLVLDTLKECDKFRERLENQLLAEGDEGWTTEMTE